MCLSFKRCQGGLKKFCPTCDAVRARPEWSTRGIEESPLALFLLLLHLLLLIESSPVECLNSSRLAGDLYLALLMYLPRVRDARLSTMSFLLSCRPHCRYSVPYMNSISGRTIFSWIPTPCARGMLLVSTDPIKGVYKFYCLLCFCSFLKSFRENFRNQSNGSHSPPDYV